MNAPLKPNDYTAYPDAEGRFGDYGGRYVAETLMPLVLELNGAYEAARADPGFQGELDGYLKHYVGRPSPMYLAARLTEHFGGAKIYFKRDELNHTGAHKINNCMGQILLAHADGPHPYHRRDRRRPAWRRHRHRLRPLRPAVRYLHGIAVDVERQKPNVFRMKLLGAEVVPVESRRGAP